MNHYRYRYQGLFFTKNVIYNVNNSTIVKVYRKLRFNFKVLIELKILILCCGFFHKNDTLTNELSENRQIKTGIVVVSKNFHS